MSSAIPVEIPQNPVVGQERKQISELQFDKFTTPHSFLCWKIRFKNQVTTSSDFPSDTLLWINEVEMVDSLDELKILVIVLWEDCSKFRDVGRFCFEQDSCRIPSSR